MIRRERATATWALALPRGRAIRLERISDVPTTRPPAETVVGRPPGAGVAGCKGSFGSPVQSATSPIRAGTAGRPIDPGHPAQETVAHVPLPAATRARHQYGRTHVLDSLDLPAPARDDLNRDRP
jgi:hypothetical protein